MIPAPAPDPIPPLDWARQAGKVPAVLDVLEAKLQLRRRHRVKAAGGVAVSLLVLAIGLWVVPFFRYTGKVATAAAQRQTLVLADGSTAELNARTNIRTDFRYGRRKVYLDQGEAFFSVVKDPSRPFFVETPTGTVRVTGTHFNVRVDVDRMAQVTLVEGSVLVSRGGGAKAATIALRPSEQLTLDEATAQTRKLTTSEVESVVSWRSGRLILDGLTLADAVARFASYHRKVITVAPEVARLRVGGSCPLDDLPGFLQFLKEALGVHILARDDGSVRIVGH